MPTTISGRVLGVRYNGRFNDTNTDPIPGGRLWNGYGTNDDGAQASWMAMRAQAILDGVPASEFAPGGPASSARSIAQQTYFWNHQPPPAARIGTSNHGWGIAVDIPSARAQAWMRRNAHRYRWSNAEGARVGEKWHWGYLGGYVAKRNALTGYTADETRWIREIDKLRRRKKLSARQEQRIGVLVRVLTEQRKAIWHAAERTGWDVNHRRARYKSLVARTT